jgi:hypothetical protein
MIIVHLLAEVKKKKKKAPGDRSVSGRPRRHRTHKGHCGNIANSGRNYAVGGLTRAL